MLSENDNELKKRFLIYFFGSLADQSSTYERYNFWFLNLVGVTTVVLFSQLEKLSLYFYFYQISWIFIFLGLAGFCGVASQYFSVLTKVNICTCKKFLEIFNSEPNLIEFIIKKENREYFFNEIQNRIIPKIFHCFFRKFLKFFIQNSDSQLAYELAAKLSVWQIISLSFGFFFYIISISTIAFLFLSV